jgi:hypothetical protein
MTLPTTPKRLDRVFRRGPARCVLLAVTAATLVACGGNDASVPPALLDAIQKQAAPTGYPPAPYGTQVGDTVKNLCFQGWTNPAKVGYAPGALAPICLADFHADATARLLLVESCAVWCAACQFEYGGSGDQSSLASALASRQAKGFRVLGTLFQDKVGAPATAANAATWAKEFSLAFPFALDGEHQIGAFTTPNMAPFNLLVDTKTMKIVLALEGNEPSVLFARVDAFLAEPAE